MNFCGTILGHIVILVVVYNF